MKPTQAEKLLGGHATGTLTEAERRLLFAAALEQQAVFDALMDEEALRELLADPAAKAQLIAALAAPASPKVVPFWRRTGVLGAAASLIVAATAGLAYLRSPNALPPVPRPATLQEPAAKAAELPAAKTVEAPAMKGPEAPGAGQAPLQLHRKAAPEQPKDANLPRQEAAAPAPPAPTPKPLAVPATVAAVAQEDAARLKEQADFHRVEARDQLAKKAEAPRSAAAVVEVVADQRSDARERKRGAQDKAAGGVSGGVIGGVVGGVVSGVAPSSPAKAKLSSGVTANAVAPEAPAWTLEAQPDGRTRVTVNAPRGRTVTLLRRGAAGVEVLPVQAGDDRGQALLQWRVDLRLAVGDALDLYLLNAPVTEPAKLPETGPVDGFRVRIHPALK